MLRFWRNPEFVRHARADLRLHRALTVAVVTLIIIALYGLSVWSAVNSDRRDDVQFFRVLYMSLLITQGVLLALWCLTACSRAISQERDLKTYDFVRVTRLTPAELIIGKLTGAPLTGYFAFLCSVPISLAAGLLAGHGVATVLLTYLLILLAVLVLSLVALWVSMQMERSAPGALVLALFALYPLSVGAFLFAESAFPGFAALSPLPALAAFYDPAERVAKDLPALFTVRIPWYLMSVLLYLTFGFWFVLMLRRNLKRELQDMSLLSPWQGIGLVVFLNLLLYALLDPGARLATYSTPYWRSPNVDDVIGPAAALTFTLLIAAGIAMLAPPERLKVWWRRRLRGEEKLISEGGPPWPWIVLSGLICYGFLWMAAILLRNFFAAGDWKLHLVGLQFLGFIVYAVRDITFLQWCMMTRMKQPVAKGALFLLLYYVAAGILVATMPDSIEYPLCGALIDLGPLLTEQWSPTGFVLGLFLQSGIAALFYLATIRRLARVPVAAPAAA